VDPVGSDLLKPEQLSWWASIVAESVLLGTLVRFHLHRKYRWFTAYIVSDIVCSLAMMWLTPDTHSNAYAYAWLGTQPILLALQVAVSVELYRVIASHYRNFDDMRPRLFWSCLLSAAVVSGLTLFIDLRHIVWTNPLLNSMFLAKRSVTFALGGFVIATSIFVRVFQIPIRANVTAHRRVATVYFLANAGYYFAMGVGLVKIHAAGIALMVITGACFTAWAVLLKPEGEDVDEPPEPTATEIAAHLERGDELLERVREVKQ
jgi:hypothetical protein